MNANYRPQKASGWLLSIPGFIAARVVKGTTGHDVTTEITEFIKWADEHNHHLVEFVATLLKR
jgi:hypothetical protein